MKINSIRIAGLRGVLNELPIQLDLKSALFYGDNGSGKSTMSDVLEWFFYDRVDHLSDGEIGPKGHDAMRNVSLPLDKPAELELRIFGKSHNHDIIKKIETKSGKLISKIANSTEVIEKYIGASAGENFILRYKELDTFACATKAQRLEKLSTIIGYSEVTNVKTTLKAVCAALSKEIRTKDFDNQINYQQRQIIEQIGGNIVSDQQFLDLVNKLVEPFSLDIKASSLADVNIILGKIKQPDNTKEINQETFLERLQEKMLLLPANLNELEDLYKKYKRNFDDILSDVSNLKKLILEKLLSVGKDVLNDMDYTSDNCPLCLIEQDRNQLLSAIGGRLDTLHLVKSDLDKLLELRKILLEQTQQTLNLLDLCLSDRQIKEPENVQYGDLLGTIKSKILLYLEASQVDPIKGQSIPHENDLLLKRVLIADVDNKSKKELEELREKRKSNTKADAYNQIKIAGNSYAQIRKLKKEKDLYKKQFDNLELVYKEFLKHQKSSLEAFFGNFSQRINSIYQFLNPNKKIENIRLVPIEEEDDNLTGITVEIDFLEKLNVSPPHKYLSESHLNCVGISFFLASVEAFNKINKFIILDDVISSFDANHRKRFADLLIEQYSEYQLILLTHENSWFELVRNRIKGKGWLVKSIKHTHTMGTYLDEENKGIKLKIQNKIDANDTDNLGSDARKYLENLLKEIASSLEVKVSFRFNDDNEDRMPYELLSEIKGTLKKRKCSELLRMEIFDRLLGSTFIGNKASHDAKYIPNSADMKAFWQDVCDFEKLFYCPSCDLCISTKYYDNVAKEIRCKDAAIKYSWQE
ncbi:MAG: hypothetical protein PHC34_13485 [Candidatus Gastranaerophilales bacterium]|nr:hypothetical protein [Candidatus Gastranaerophilales bacterium]